MNYKARDFRLDAVLKVRDARVALTQGGGMAAAVALPNLMPLTRKREPFNRPGTRAL